MAGGSDRPRDRLLRDRAHPEARGKEDPYGYVLRVTQPAIVDEVAAAAELVMTKRSLSPGRDSQGRGVPQGRVRREEHGPEEEPGPLQVRARVAKHRGQGRRPFGRDGVGEVPAGAAEALRVHGGRERRRQRLVPRALRLPRHRHRDLHARGHRWTRRGAGGSRATSSGPSAS